MGKQITKDFADKLAEKFVMFEQKEAYIKIEKLKVFSDMFDREVGQIREVRIRPEDHF